MTSSRLTLLGAVALVLSGLAEAQVVPVDLDGNGSTLAFHDVANALYWSVPGVVASANFANASNAVSALVIEGRGGWRLPTVAEFSSLYATQGQIGSGMTNSPFPPYATWYWTSTVYPDNTLQNMAFAPGNLGSFEPYFRTTAVGVWAVTPVPEPGTALLAVAGLVALAAKQQRWFLPR